MNLSNATKTLVKRVIFTFGASLKTACFQAFARAVDRATFPSEYIQHRYDVYGRFTLSCRVESKARFRANRDANEV